jgi:hypothetical protein
MPKTYGNASVRIWAQRGTSKFSMYQVGQKILFSRITQLKALTSQSEGSVTEDIAGRYIEINLSYQSGPIGSLYDLASGAVGRIGSIPKTLAEAIDAAKKLAPDALFGFPDFPATDDIDGVFQTADGPNPAPPNDSASRGTYIGHLVAAALLAPGETPKKPSNPLA